MKNIKNAPARTIKFSKKDGKLNILFKATIRSKKG